MLCLQTIKQVTSYCRINTPYNHRLLVLGSKADHSNLCCPVRHTGCMFQI